jgi:drug/metabolite transporter (DMT)-like permease
MGEIDGMAMTRLTRAASVPQMPARHRAVLALLVSTIFWGTSFVAADRVLEDIPPITLAFLRFAIALAVLVPLLLSRGRWPVWGRESALMGLAGIAMLFVLQNGGVRLAGPTDASLIMGGGAPVLVAILARITLGERVHGRGRIGIVASVAGVVMVVFAASTSVGGSVSGDLLLLGSAASGAIFTILGRRAYARHDVLAVLTGSMAWGLVFLAPAMIVEATVVGMRSPSAGDALAMLYLGAGCSGVAFLLWGYGLRHVAAAETAVIANMEVPIGIAAAAIVAGAGPTSAQLAGGVLVLIGAWLASVPPGSRWSLMGRTGRADRPLLREA